MGGTTCSVQGGPSSPGDDADEAMLQPGPESADEERDPVVERPEGRKDPPCVVSCPIA